MSDTKFPDPVDMEYNCGIAHSPATRKHVPVTVNGDLRWQCTKCGKIK